MFSGNPGNQDDTWVNQAYESNHSSSLSVQNEAMTSSSVSKKDIARSFGKAAASYDEMAHFQRWTSDELTRRLQQVLDTNQIDLNSASSTLLDLGCGTGYSLPKLADIAGKSCQCIGMDLSEDMVNYARQAKVENNFTWLAGDGESLPFASNSMDMVFSSLAIQWCGQLDTLFAEVFRVLKPGGVWAFSTLVDGTLTELASAWAQVDDYQHVNRFERVAAYVDSGENAGFEGLLFEQVRHCLFFDSVRQLTRELKGIGAHNMTSERPTGLTGKTKMKQFLNAYETLRDLEGKLPATYEVFFGLMRKPGF